MIFKEWLMDFETIVRKFIRMPWEVCDSQEHWQDYEVSANLEHSAGAGAYFKTPPKPENVLTTFMAISVPIICASGCSPNHVLQVRNRWKNLSEAEKNFVLVELGVDDEIHQSMLVLHTDKTRLQRLASYIAAAYSFTTYVKAKVITFQELGDIIYDSFGTDTIAIDEIKRAGLLIITDIGSGAMLGADKIYGSLVALLDYRTQHFGFNILMDCAEGDVAKAMRAKIPMYRENIISMYASRFKAELRMETVLTGDNVYIFPVTMQGAARERGKTIII
jgi:hypothetical protein